MSASDMCQHFMLPQNCVECTEARMGEEIVRLERQLEMTCKVVTAVKEERRLAATATEARDRFFKEHGPVLLHAMLESAASYKIAVASVDSALLELERYIEQELARINQS